MSFWAVHADRWDHEDLGTAGLVRAFDGQCRRLAQRWTWGRDLVGDLFFVFLKADPHLVESVPAGREMQAAIIEQVMSVPVVPRLRRVCAGDVFWAASVAAGFAQVLARVLADVGDSDSEAGEAAAAAALEAGGVGERLAEHLEAVVATTGAWGFGPGALKTVAVPERETLARVLDTVEARQVADLFGRLRAAAFGALAGVEDGWGDVTDLGLGAEPARVVAQEWLGLAEAGLEHLFYARLAESELLRYELAEQVDHGGIVLCVDGSQSMGLAHQGYSRRAWAQAFVLLVTRLACQSNRPLHVVTFGSNRECKHMAFNGPGSYTPSRVHEATTAYFDGGTSFERPLRKALALVDGAPTEAADVVFVTDGLCRIPERVLAAYRAGVARCGTRTWALSLGESDRFVFADATWQVRDLLDGRGVAAILTALSSP